MSLLEEALVAHGGRAAWESAGEVTAALRSGGLALGMKRAGALFRDYEARIAIAEPRTTISPFPGVALRGSSPQAGYRGVFEGDAVRIETDAGRTVAARANMRRRFPGLRRRLLWDLDALYFAGYAWNYFTRRCCSPRRTSSSAGDKLRRAAEIPTLGKADGDRLGGRLVRLDYTAEVFGRWARAQHLCGEHRSFDGLLFQPAGGSARAAYRAPAARLDRRGPRERQAGLKRRMASAIASPRSSWRKCAAPSIRTCSPARDLVAKDLPGARIEEYGIAVRERDQGRLLPA